MATLVTGAAGFIGYHVTRALLARGDSVIGIDNLNPYYCPRLKEDRLAEIRKAAPDSFEFKKLDFADYETLRRELEGVEFDRIIHLGAQAGVRHSIDNPHAYLSSNLAGHLNLMEIARHRRSAHFVYASSSSVYGGNETLPFRVEDPVDHPISLYAATKRADELISESYSHLYRLPATGLRFFTVYGSWGRPDMAMWIFTHKILAGEPIQIFNYGKMRRDFTYIDDVVAGVIACHDHAPKDDGLKKPGGGKATHSIYNIGNSRSEEMMHLVALLEEACGRPAVRDFKPLQPGDVVATYADIEPIRRDFGFAPSTSIEDGVPRFVEWYRHYSGM
jgi:UDP-glucuronate 4-epimerase